MNVLIAVASRHGATREIADAIADELEHHGQHARVCDAGDVTGFDGYDAVVLGSAIYEGRWLAPAKALAKRLEPELGSRPLWLFSSGMPHVQKPGEPDPAPAFTTRIADRVDVRGEAVFSGKLDADALGPIERTILKAVHTEVGDFRDWAAIDAFAAGISSTLDAIADGAVAPAS
jgi:menaquinone-dependent protoporphyrinogen oxidase